MNNILYKSKRRKAKICINKAKQACKENRLCEPLLESKSKHFYRHFYNISLSNSYSEIIDYLSGGHLNSCSFYSKIFLLFFCLLKKISSYFHLPFINLKGVQ